mgnify:FL=1
MELIRHLPREKDKNGNWQSYAEFLCPFDNLIVVKRLGHGKRDKSCGCQRYKLIVKANTGKKRTEKQRKNISESHKGQKAWNKGIPQTKEAKQKQSKTKIENGSLKGQNNPNFGKVMSEEQRSKISNKIKEQYKNGRKRSNTIFLPMEKHILWNNGSSFEPYSSEFNKKFKQFIKDRDFHICQTPNCMNTENLHIHHIDYDKKNNSSENAITLCASCHTKTNGKNNRQYWINYYKEIVSIYI